MVTNLELFKHVMYYMFKKDNMPELNLLELGIKGEKIGIILNKLLIDVFS